MRTDRVNVAVMIGALGAILALTGFFAFGSRKAPATRPAAQEVTALAVSSSMPGTVPSFAAPRPAGPLQPAPAMRDPFRGGPVIKVPHDEKPTPEVPVSNVPAVSVAGDRRIVYELPTQEKARTREAPATRYSGWACAENGQAWAIIEEHGRARAMRVGDKLDGSLVTMITADFLVLRDDTGHEKILKLRPMNEAHGVPADAW